MNKRNSLINYYQYETKQNENVIESKIGDDYAKLIQKIFRKFVSFRNKNIFQTKKIKEHEDLQMRAQMTRPSSDYSKVILNFMNAFEDNANVEQEHIEKPKQDGILIEKDQIYKIGGIIFSFDIYVIRVNYLKTKENYLAQKNQKNKIARDDNIPLFLTENQDDYIIYMPKTTYSMF
ncbi:hypothetical protein IMG5_185350 [Ichthyophthirius multifiliis]|uniref:Uncharacterized protein n=1 Tax=Ichthyophthirius multifiliis TaxID=5932 RepID=G0R3G3_ICHMU|nr:hypothetical protein IMG5_185350 [Ichthyophthirius multifiliis]EGR27952.1 hypothetical protein IMG5_185350 [Ichthyophthirius multifiliis]|eukprot:XP_004027297.1 hypothetical protein IMG5_185350 [Ichthyophthirius multifiliis]